MSDFIGRQVAFRGLQLQVKKLLGEGGFAFVYLTVDDHTGNEFVLKRMIISGSAHERMARNEMRIMERLKHPNIVSFVTSDVTDNGGSREAYIVMEYCQRGHLFDLLSHMQATKQNFTQAAALEQFEQIASAVQHLHHQEPTIAHRDLKLENCLLTSTGRVKLCDFGSCVFGPQACGTASERSTQEELIEKNTTQMYRAPEMCDLYSVRYLDEAVDVWALGCILFTMLYLKHPFQNEGNLGILGGQYTVPESTLYSPDVVELISRMLKVNVPARANIDEVCAYVHALLSGHALPPRPAERIQAENAAKQAEAQLQRMRQERQQQRRGPQRKAPSDQAKKINPNSAAARRLNFRGKGQSGAALSPSSAAAAEMAFPAPAPVSVPATSFGTDFGNFADFGETPAPAPAAAPDAGFASFEDAFAAPAAAAAGFDAAPPPAAGADFGTSDAGFGSFGDVTAPASAAPANDPFAAPSAAAGSAAVDDPFAAPSVVSGTDPFAAPSAASPAARSSGFDAFNSGRGAPSAISLAGETEAVTDLLGNVALSAAPTPDPAPADLFGAPAPTPAAAAAPAPAPASTPMDPFGGQADLLGSAPASAAAPAPRAGADPFAFPMGAPQAPQGQPAMMGGGGGLMHQPPMMQTQMMPPQPMMGGPQMMGNPPPQQWQQQQSSTADPFGGMGQAVPGMAMGGGSAFSNFNSGQGAQYGGPLQPQQPFGGGF